MFPFLPSVLCTPAACTKLASCLPSYDRASSLLETYFANFTRFTQHVDYSQARDELLPEFYPNNQPIDPERVSEEQMHDLALFFALLSRGALDDAAIPELRAESETYAHLCRAALALRNPLGHGSLSCCQAIMVLAMCLMPQRSYFSHEVAWSLMGFAFQIALSVRVSASFINALC